MPYAVCPECDEDILIPGKVRLGQRLSCERCGAQLEVVGLDPIELDWAYEPAEEFDEEDLFDLEDDLEDEELELEDEEE
jgi:alpha-aminoadipate carrier protein LysW